MVLRQYKLSSFAETKRLLSIDEVLCNLVDFNEKLYVFNEDGKRIGRFSIMVDTTDIMNCKSIVVHMSNRIFNDNKVSETVVTGILSLSLKTLEECRYESSEVNGYKHERKFYLLRERTKYFCSVTETVCGITRKHQKTIPFSKAIGIIGEAANIIIMRTLVVRGFQGILHLQTILSNGKRCSNYYVSKKFPRVVNGVKTDATTIYRCVTDNKKYNVTSTCSFTRAGQLFHCFWSNSGYFLHIDPDLVIYDGMVDGNDRIPLEKHWNRDKQVFSYYLDKRVERLARIESYRMTYQELQRAFSDMLQYILIMKPDDVICPALEFFSSFGKNTSQKCTSLKE